MFTNIRSIVNNNKREEIALMVEKEHIDIIGIAESWSNSGIKDAEISMLGFTVFRKDRNGEGGGGILLYIRDYIEPQEVMMGRVWEIAWAKIKGSNR